MSELHRAVQAEIDAHTPALTPPFDAIKARKRSRDRNRLAAAAALGIVGVASAAFAVPGLGEQRTDRLAPFAAPSPDPRPAPPAWDGRSGPIAEDGAAATCVETYSPTTLANKAFAFDGTVTAVGASVTNRPDKGQLELAGVTFTVNTWYRGGDQGTVTVDLPPAGASPVYEIGSRLLVSGEPRWGGEPLDQPIASLICGGFTRYYDPETAQAWQKAFAAIDLIPETAVDYFGLTATFVSPTYGYAFGYVDRGGLTPATELWDPGNQPIDDLNFDPRFDSVETGYAAYFEAASTPLPKAVAIDEWVEEHVTALAAGGCDIPRRQQAEITVDGQSGRVAQCANRVEATVVAGGRLYLFVLGHDRRDGRAQFDAWIATVELTPDTAVR